MASGKRALVIAYCFPPHAGIGTFRTLRLVKHLEAAGWRVQVLTGGRATYSDGTPFDEGLLRSVPSAVDIVRAPGVRGLEWAARASRPFRRKPAGSSGADHSASHAAPSSTRRQSIQETLEQLCAIPDNDAGWCVPAVMRGLVAVARTRPDVIYSSAPPWTGHLVAYALASFLRCPWVADFRDPWARGPWREDRPEFAKRASSFLESLVVRRADGVLFTTRALRDEVVGHYGPWLAPKSHVVRNGCDPDDFAGIAGVERTDCFVLAHLGSLYGGRDPLPLFRALASAVQAGTIDRRRFRLRLIGGGPLDLLSAKCRELGLSDMVEVLPRVSRRESLGAMTSAHALLLIQPGHPLSVPGKSYEYLAAGKPVLALTDEGETADLVRASGNGVVVPSASEAAIREALESLSGGRIAVCPPALSTFDGRLRAAEMAAFLEAIWSLRRRAAQREFTSVVHEEV